jgi:cell cycle sensor histidine kinase DivJ
VKGLVELHGGKFEIASRIGEGTRVTVRLPREAKAPEAVETSVIERLTPRAPSNEGEKVKRRA